MRQNVLNFLYNFRREIKNNEVKDFEWKMFNGMSNRFNADDMVAVCKRLMFPINWWLHEGDKSVVDFTFFFFNLCKYFEVRYDIPSHSTISPMTFFFKYIDFKPMNKNKLLPSCWC